MTARPPVEADARQRSLPAQHRRAGGWGRTDSAQRHGYWRWTGEPIVPPSLVELIESRIGDLPSSVGDVIDALAVGEPIDLASLVQNHRSGGGRGCRNAWPHHARARTTTASRYGFAHPLYGEVRRRRAPSTRLRRLRGRVAAELAESDRRDDMQVVVRRAVLTLDSDLEPDPALLVTAARGRVGAGGPRNSQIDWQMRQSGPEGERKRPSCARFAPLQLSHGEETDATLASIPTTEFTSAGPRQTRLHAGRHQALHARRPRGREEAHRRRVAGHVPGGRPQLHRCVSHRVLGDDGQAGSGEGIVERPRPRRVARFCGRGDGPSGRLRIRGRWPHQRSRGRRLRRIRHCAARRSTPRICGSPSPTATSAHSCSPVG